MKRYHLREDDIPFSERLLGVTFNTEQRTILLCNEPKDIKACPGSGKTTTLVGKLAMLARAGYTGICVLSHTNVAGSEIKDKLGPWAGAVTQYPNYVGTIQSFVDRFLALPAIAERFGVRPWAIDDDAFASVANARFWTLPKQAIGFLKNKIEWDTLLGRLRFDATDIDKVILSGGEIGAGPGSTTYEALKALKMELANDGCFAYADTLALAQWFMRTHPDAVGLIRARFPYVFVDEMQDTSPEQSAILDAVFGHGVVLQRFGDPNQAIYHQITEANQPGWMIASKPLEITYSSRLSESIASLSSNVCWAPMSLRGNPAHPRLPHTIFLFDPATVSLVLPKFAQLIADSGLDLTNGRFRAIGAVRKPSDKVTIPSYWDSFALPAKQPSASFEALMDYMYAAQVELQSSGSGAKARNFIMMGLLKALRLEGIKNPALNRNFSEHSLLELLRTKHQREYDLVRANLLKVVTALAKGEMPCLIDLRADFEAGLSPLLPKGFRRPQAQAFIIAPGSAPQGNTSKIGTNVFDYRADRGVVRVTLDTIHSVKGETHQATLYLETFRYVYDLKNLVPYLTGKRPELGARAASFLPLAYVAMTRPTHLLCLALHRKHLSSLQERELAAIGWGVIDLTTA